MKRRGEASTCGRSSGEGGLHKHEVLEGRALKFSSHARRASVDIEQLRKESGFYDLFMESQSHLHNSEVCKRSITSNKKVELKLLKEVDLYKRQHGHVIAKLESDRRSVKLKMEEYSARKRAIYKDRVKEFDQTGDKDMLGPFYRSSSQRDNRPVRDDVFQSGVIYHGLLYPGAFPHKVDMRRRKSYQDTQSLRKQSVSQARVDTSLLLAKRRQSTSPAKEHFTRSKSAPPTPSPSEKFDDIEQRQLSRVPLSPNQYLMVMTPRSHPRNSFKCTQTNEGTKKRGRLYSAPDMSRSSRAQINRSVSSCVTGSSMG